MTRLNLSLKQYNQLIGKGTKGKRAPKPVTLPLVQVQWDARIIDGGVWIQIPFPLPSMNEWMKWDPFKLATYKKELSNAVYGLKLTFNLPRFERVTVQSVYYFKVGRRRDSADNYGPKLLHDALVRGGILLDDNSELIDPRVPELKKDKEKPRTEIFIWRRDNG